MFTKDYFKDRSILLLSLISLILTVVSIILVLARSNLGNSKIVWRYLPGNVASNVETVDSNYIYAFIVVAIISLMTGLVMSYKLYDLYKYASYISLILTIIILVANILISDAILRI